MYYTDPTNGQFVSEYTFPGDYPGEVRRDTEWFDSESEAARHSATGATYLPDGESLLRYVSRLLEELGLTEADAEDVASQIPAHPAGGYQTSVRQVLHLARK